jgi:arabinofuranosyltransferase
MGLPWTDPRLTVLLWLFCLLIFVRNAWVCEDAFITYRVADNLVRGYGLRWNPLERVQVYTHPLWMMLVSALHFFARDVYFSAIVLSLACSGLTVWLLLSRVMVTTAKGLLVVVLLTFSKAFIDFSSSGLENPLSHLLLVLFFVEVLKPEEQRSFRKMIRWAALLLVTRMDLVWLVLPSIVHLTLRHEYWRSRHWRIWIGLWPYAAWEAFSLFYYGFFFPNSAYAKLAIHLPLRALADQGLSYLLNSLAWDPLTLFALAVLVLVALCRFRTDRAIAMLGLGVVLHLAYVVRVGGDYMTGRFLSAPFLVSLLVISRVSFESTAQFCTVMGIAVAVGVSAPRPPILMRDEYVGLGSSPQRVDDERGYRYETSLLRQNPFQHIGNLGGWVADGVAARRDHVRVIVYRNIGYFGFFAGPEVHIIDPYGIGDPLMARMPFTETTGSWAAGHYMRTVPEGYPEAAIGTGEIADHAVADYWRKLTLVIRGPLFDLARLRQIARFNLGLDPPPLTP